MKILFDHQIFSKQQHGGISRYFFELAKNLSLVEEDNVGIFAPYFKNNYLRGSNLANGRYSNDFPGSSIALRSMNSLIGLATVKAKKNIDIFHETYYSQLDLKPHGAKRIITVFDMIHEKFPSSFARYDTTALSKKNAISRADHIICISNSTQNDLIDILKVPINKISVVHLGQSFPTKLSSNIRPIKDPYLLYVGQRHSYKNFIGLLIAFSNSQLRKDGYKIVCFGGGAFSPTERNIFIEHGISEYEIIQISGSDNALAELYQHAALFVYPSYYEGFGIPLLEAMSQNCPIACSDTSSMPEVCGNAAVYFNPHNSEDIKDKIELLASGGGVSDRILEEGSKRITNFSWQRCAMETRRIYEQI